MNIKVVFICRNCGAEVIRDYTSDDPRGLVRMVANGEECPAPTKELVRYRDSEVDTRAPAAAPDRIHMCGDKCIGVLEATSITW